MKSFGFALSSTKELNNQLKVNEWLSYLRFSLHAACWLPYFNLFNAQSRPNSTQPIYWVSLSHNNQLVLAIASCTTSLPHMLYIKFLIYSREFIHAGKESNNVTHSLANCGTLQFILFLFGNGNNLLLHSKQFHFKIGLVDL